MNELETRQLRYFVAVAEELHFGRAAGRLGIAQPPLSKAIRDLERQLGVQLLTRTTRQVKLTPAGQTLLADARDVLAAAAAAARRARRAGHQEPALHDGRADVALVLTPFDKRRLDSEVLVTEPRLVALPAADPLAAQTTIRLPDLAGRRLPNGSSADSGNVMPPSESAFVKDLSQLFNLVEVGELVWFLPAW